MSNPTHLLFKDNGYFKVVAYNGKDPKYNAHTWKCECRCGKIIILRTDVFNSGATKSCGCTRKTIFVKGHSYGKRFEKIHGLSNHPLHRIWNRIIERCYYISPNHKSYKYYRGKKIKVCDEWKNNFKIFYDWAIKNNWQKGFSIDRINPEGNYEPSNCEFVTRSENSKRMAKKNFFFGEYNGNATLLEDDVLEIKRLLQLGHEGASIAREFGIHRKTVYLIRDGKLWNHLN